MAKDLFGFPGVHGRGCEWEFFGWKTKDVCGQKTEFLPYGCHAEVFEFLSEHDGVNLGMVHMKKHGPVAYLSESYTSCNHVSYGVVQYKECVEGSGCKSDTCVLIIPYR